MKTVRLEVGFIGHDLVELEVPDDATEDQIIERAEALDNDGELKVVEKDGHRYVWDEVEIVE